MPDDLHEIRGIEIMRSGKWNNTTFDDDDLAAMVAAFPEVGFGVPLKLGHSETIGGEAYGWVSRLYKRGSTLLADFKDVPTELFARIKRRAFDHVSIEAYFDLQRAGRVFKRVLKAVALLGAETPAVSGLKPLRAVVNRQLSLGPVYTFTTAFKMGVPMNTQIFTVNHGDRIDNKITKLAAAFQHNSSLPLTFEQAVEQVLASDHSLAVEYANFVCPPKR